MMRRKSLATVPETPPPAGMSNNNKKLDPVAERLRDMEEVWVRHDVEHLRARFDLALRLDILKPVARSWVIDLRRTAPALPGDQEVMGRPFMQQVPTSGTYGPQIKPNLTLIAQDDEVFLNLAEESKDFKGAWAAGRIRLQGELLKLKAFKDLMGLLTAAAPADNLGGARLIPREKWQPDRSSGVCGICCRRFTLIQRRHHCRYCGVLACNDCTKERLGGRRTCAECWSEARQNIAQGLLTTNDDSSGAYSTANPSSSPVSSTGTVYSSDPSISVESCQGPADRLYTFSTLLFTVNILGILMAALATAHYVSKGLRSLPVKFSLNNDSFVLPQYCESLLGFPVDLVHCSLVLPLSLLLSILFLRHRTRRSIRAFCVATTLVAHLEWTKVKARGLSTEASEQAWDRAHLIAAIYLKNTFFTLKGLYLKLGQYISSRADLMPPAFVEQLSYLQDASPPNPLSTLRGKLEKSIGAKLQDMFLHVEEKALASASIAQVHAAKLKDGTRVVIKVQHADVRSLLDIDFANLSTIFRAIAWLEKDFDFTMLMDEWSRAVKKELDFTLEGHNIQRALETVEKSGLDVVVPKPLFVSPEVLVMTFCEGFKATDEQALNASNIDRTQFVSTVCHIFAYMQYVEGFFNADPHPGNIFVQLIEDETASRKGLVSGQSQARPVLLDWGMTKSLAPKIKLGNALIVYSGYQMDIAGMMDGMDDCGIDTSSIDLFDNLSTIRFMLRDTAPTNESREMNKQFMERFTEKMREKPEAQKNALKVVVPELMFLSRVTELLQGLGSKLGVRVNFLDIMAEHAKAALLARHNPSPEKAIPLFYPTSALSFLDRKVRRLLQEMVKTGEVLGSQVVVIKNGRCLVDAAVGTKGELDPRPVTPSTLFCGYSICNALLSILAHRLVEEGRLSYHDTVADLLPDFASEGKGVITLHHLLTHRSGLQYAFPDKATVHSLCERDKVLSSLSRAFLANAPGGHPAFHYFSYGWLLQPILERASGMTLQDLIRTKVLEPAKVKSKEVCFGNVGEDQLDSVAMTQYSLKDLELMGSEQEGGLAAMADMLGAGDSGAPDSRAIKVFLSETLKGREYLLDHRIVNSRIIRTKGFLPSLNGFFSARAFASILECLNRSERLTSTHRSSITSDAALSPILSPETLRTMRSSPSDEEGVLSRMMGRGSPIRLAMGVQLFGMRRKANDGSGVVQRYNAYGHASACGQVALSDPLSGLVVVVTSNKAGIPGQRNLGQEVLNLVCEELELGEVLPIW